MPDILRFDQFQVDLTAGQVFGRGVNLGLRDQSFQVLALLLERAGHVVTRDELFRRLWHDDVFVDFDNGLNTAVARLREALGDSAAHPRFIETLPKRGYRFIAPVTSPPKEAADVSPPRMRLMVLPFSNSSGDPGQEYFCDAMTDEIITSLASLAPRELGVIARTTAMRYKGTRKDVAQIGRELNLDYLVEGAARSEDRRAIVTLQLVRSRDQIHLFARRYEIDLSDVFQALDRMAHEVAAEIPCLAGRIPASASSRRAGRRPTEDVTAYNEYIEGRFYLWKWTAEGVEKARHLFESAIARDPGFALAYDALAEMCWHLGFWGFAPPSQTDVAGRGYALRAIELDDTLAESHTLLGFFPKRGCWDWHEKLRCAEHGHALDPVSPTVRLRYAIVLLVLGRLDEAIEELEGALELDPLSLMARCWLAVVSCLARRNEQALAHACHAVELEPAHFIARMVLGQVFLMMHRFDESCRELRLSVELSGGLPLPLGWLGLASGLGGRKDDARAVLDTLTRASGERYVMPTSLAWTYFGLGEVDAAFDWMNRAADEHDRWLSTLATYPFLDPLRGDPRFDSLLRKIHLKQ